MEYENTPEGRMPIGRDIVVLILVLMEYENTQTDGISKAYIIVSKSLF